MLRIVRYEMYLKYTTGGQRQKEMYQIKNKT